MPHREPFTYPSRDGVTEIHGWLWMPEESPRAVLQIAHGMAECIDRYEPFALYLNQLGIAVTGNDHLGHGDSVTDRENWGYFADRDSLEVLLADMFALTERTKARFPGVPYVLLGHSMGSFLARNYLCRYGDCLQGAILMGTGYQPEKLVKAGLVVCSLLAKGKGWHHRSALVDGMAFGGYNKAFRPARTKMDWLSRDTEMVDRYMADPRCGFRFTLNGFHTLFTAIKQLHDPDRLAKMPKDLPVLFVSGEEDPVGDFGKGVRLSADTFLAAGMQDVDLWLYPGRHEILNETGRDLVFAELARWLVDIAEGNHVPPHDPGMCGDPACSACRKDLPDVFPKERRVTAEKKNTENIYNKG
ncbi:MAG: lysophospholipase [Clostridia bacterium]|nr:lysophospholipase [Clostridia bacterium]